MKCPALFALMVAAGVTSAAAEPKQEEISGRVRLTDNDDQSPPAPRAPGEWVELASSTPARHGKEFIIVGKEAGTFSKLRIDATKGRTNVVRVDVHFDDGKIKTVRLGRALHAKRAESALVDLGEPRSIDRVVITTDKRTRGEYALYGAAGDGGASR